jgi:hypothetical protein
MQAHKHRQRREMKETKIINMKQTKIEQIESFDTRGNMEHIITKQSKEKQYGKKKKNETFSVKQTEPSRALKCLAYTVHLPAR